MKQKNLWKLLQALVTVVLCAAALAGCGGGSGTAVTKTTATDSVSTAALATSNVAVNAPAGVTLSIPANTALTDASNQPVTGAISSSVSYSNQVADLPAAAATLPSGTTLAAFVDITLGTVKYFSTPVTLAIPVTASGAAPGDTLEVYSFNGTQWSYAGTEIVDANGMVKPLVKHLSIWGVFKSAAPRPLRPSVVVATAGDAQVTVSWAQVSGATSYNVYYGTASGVTSATTSKITGITALSQVVGTLPNGTAHYFVVTAVNGAGESIASAEATATPVLPPPAAPAVVATAASGRVALTWNAVSGADSYNIYYGTTPEVSTAGAPQVQNAGPCYIANLTNGTPYYFVVTAVNASGATASTTQSATPAAVTGAPVAPKGLVASAANASTILDMSAVTGATSYNVYYSTKSGVYPLTPQITGAVTPQTVTGLSNGTKYYFLFTAVNASGESEASTEKSATPSATPQAPGSPTGVTVTPAAGKITVKWSVVTPATTYNVYYLAFATAPALDPDNATVMSTGTKVSVAAPTLQSVLTVPTSTYFVVVTAANGNGESSGQTLPKKVVVP